MPKPPFIPKPGQVDFTQARYAPVINCVVKFKDKILIVQRSADLNFYPGVWNGISGFLDDTKTLEEKAKEEMREELDLQDSQIISIKPAGLFEQQEPNYNKVWIVHPALVEVNTDQIKLDWEAQNYKWVTLEEAKTHKLLPGFDKVLEAVEQIIK
jgi:ADP-ribose pyrophosphatase YjhB (NUDIX family)